MAHLILNMPMQIFTDIIQTATMNNYQWGGGGYLYEAKVSYG